MAVITGAVASGGLLGSSQADASMIGQSAKTFNKAALEVAQAMEKQGAPMEAIRKTTGYQFGTPIHRGVDGKWRQEIGDFEFEIEEGKVIDLDKWVQNANGEVFNHPDLKKAYPELFNEKMEVFFENDGGGGSYNGEDGHKVTIGSRVKFSDNLEKINRLEKELKKLKEPGSGNDYFDENYGETSYKNSNDFVKDYDRTVKNFTERLNREKRLTYFQDGARETALHELQHGIQNIEGFAKGGMPGNDYESYARLAGEEEARQTQKRIGLSMKERIDRNPDLDFDTPPEQQIVRGQAGSATTPVMAATGLTGLGLSGIQALNGENAKQIYKFADKRNKRKMLKAAYENTPFYKGVSDISSLVGAGDVLRGIMAAKLAATGKMNEYPGIDKQISDAEAMKTETGKKIESAFVNSVAPVLSEFIPFYEQRMKQIQDFSQSMDDSRNPELSALRAMSIEIPSSIGASILSMPDYLLDTLNKN